MLELYKQKGAITECSNYRGLLIGDHIAKCIISLLQDSITPKYCEAMLAEQMGGVPSGGTEYASHLIRSVIDYAAMKSLSVFILFVDLEKAYDRVIREILFGFGSMSAQEQLRHLESLGIDGSVAADILERLRVNGCVFERWNVDPKVIALVRELHHKCWFRVGGLQSVVTSTTGGRQGYGEAFN